jgi:hypothetical protein
MTLDQLKVFCTVQLNEGKAYISCRDSGTEQTEICLLGLFETSIFHYEGK